VKIDINKEKHENYEVLDINSRDLKYTKKEFEFEYTN